MPQKYLNPFILEPMDIVPGIEVRNDEVFVTDVKFTINFKYLYTFYITQVNAVFCRLDYTSIRKIKALCGISPSVEPNDSIKAVSKIIVNDMMCVIHSLTGSNTTYSLLEYIMCDVSHVPKTTLDIIQFINSHRIVDRIEGSGNSTIKWRKVDRVFDCDDFNEEPDEFSPIHLVTRLTRLVEIVKECNIEEIVPLSNLGELFDKSDYVLNGSVTTIDQNKVSMNVGRGFSREDLMMYLLCSPTYTFSNSSILQGNTISVTEKQIQQLMRIPVHLLSDDSINMTANEKLVIDYLESPMFNKANQSTNYEGLKSSNLPFNSPRSTSGSTMKKGGKAKKPIKFGMNREKEVVDKGKPSAA
jgi:hypothetical protein